MPIHFTEKRDIETALQMDIRDYPDAGLNHPIRLVFGMSSFGRVSWRQMRMALARARTGWLAASQS
jgi:hypothetical protein